MIVASLSACSGVSVDSTPEIILAKPTANIAPTSTALPEVTNFSRGSLNDQAIIQTQTGGTELEPDTVLTIWHSLDETGSLAFRETIDLYKVLRPGTQFNLIYLPRDDLMNRYIREVDAELGPSIILAPGEWGPALFDLEIIIDLKPLLPSNIETNLTPPALTASTYLGSLISLPLFINGSVMFRNSAIIPESPETIIDLVSTAQNANKGPIVGSYLEVGTLFSLPQLSACGGVLMDPYGHPAFAGEIGLCWIDLLRTLQEAGPTSFDSNDDLTRFIAGKAGMIFEGTWNISPLLDHLGENLVIDPWPAYKDKHLSGYVWTNSLYVNPNLSEAETQSAIAFLVYLLTPGTQTLLVQTGLIPAVLNLEPEDPLITQAMLALSGGTAYPGNPEMAYYWNPMKSALRLILVEKSNPYEVLLNTSNQIFSEILAANNTGSSD
jgi:maltose-binding protein MalE